MRNVPAVLLAFPKADTDSDRGVLALVATREAFPEAGVYRAADAVRGRKGQTTQDRVFGYEAVVIVETPNGTLSRGVYEIAEAALAVGVPSYVLRRGEHLAGGRGRLVPVIGVLAMDSQAFASGAGRVIASTFTAPFVSGPESQPGCMLFGDVARIAAVG